MVVRQRYDISAERFRSLDITFKDPETGEYVTEKFPSGRFYVPSGFAGDASEVDNVVVVPDGASPDETTATGDRTRVTPSEQHSPTVLPGRPSDPILVPQLPPSEPGKGRELVPNNTGGNQTELGPIIELAPGFPEQEQEPQIYITPDEREKLNRPSIVTSQNHSQTSGLLIEEGKQGKHVVGHNNFEDGRSEFNHDNPQSLVEKFAGSGQAVNQLQVGQPGFRERVDFGEIIGIYKDESEGISLPTNVGIIHYSKKGVHIVPSRPKL